MYVNRVTELWFVGKELCRTKQLFGVTGELAQEITGRNYEMIKGGTLRMKIESKVEHKARLGKSPDLADAAFLCLDLARQRHSLMAVEPIETGNSLGYSKPRRSIKRLSNMLSTDTLHGT